MCVSLLLSKTTSWHEPMDYQVSPAGEGTPIACKQPSSGTSSILKQPMQECKEKVHQTWLSVPLKIVYLILIYTLAIYPSLSDYYSTKKNTPKRGSEHGQGNTVRD
jgi:hypothetical protein